MKSNIAMPVWQTIGLGIIAGMRTSSAPVIVNEILKRHPARQLSNAPLKFIRSANFGLLAKMMAAGS